MKIAVLGAGSIGTYVGASLAASGLDVVLIGRAKMQASIRAHGVLLTDLAGRQQKLAPEQIRYELVPQALQDAGLILVTVKSAASASAALQIAQYGRRDALVISLQNGIGNAGVLREGIKQALIQHQLAAEAGDASRTASVSFAPSAPVPAPTEFPPPATGSPETMAMPTVLGGMVPFNVVQMPDGRLHRGSFGELTIEAHPQLAAWQAGFAAAHLPLLQARDFPALQWGKLLLNLNNPLNALSDLPLRTELAQRAWRQCLALLMDEALQVLKAARIHPAKVAAVPASWLPTVLRLPDSLFKLVAGKMLKIDPEARSSMWEDLQAGRATEIDFINGAVTALAARHGVVAPANQCLIDMIHQVEQGGQRRWRGSDLYLACHSALPARRGSHDRT